MPTKKSEETKILIDTNRQTSATGDVLDDRVKKSHKDRVFLSRCIAALLLGLSVANVIPGTMQIYDLIQSHTFNEIASWIHWQLFVAFLLLIYAVFLLQIPDWSSLRAISAFTLVLAALFGFIVAGLLLDGSEGKIAMFLELPFSLAERTKIWCVAMLLILLGASYVSGMEAMAWRKMDLLFRQFKTQHAKQS